MAIRKTYSLRRILILFVFLGQIGQISIVYGQNIDDEVSAKTELQDKYYRQALFYYFQGEKEQALSQIEQSKSKLKTLDSRSSLFEAGLQLSAGLLQQAKKTLVNFEDLQTLDNKNIDSTTKADKADELTLISLLSLTDQYLQQGDTVQARDTLKRIKSVSPTYYPQYHVLSQLAYWPEKVTLLPIKSPDNISVSSPYIQLNDALRLIELLKYEEAITTLKTIKITTWHKQESDFWKTLFLNEVSFSSQSDEMKMAITQGQAIQDYAQLLLAQIYISQQHYDLAFAELKAFPEQSPYAESALFLFAFASQQIKQYDIAFNLLTLLYKKYPHSQLGWQSAELMAQQVSEQHSLSQGVSVYQMVEDFFLQRQQELKDFSKAFQKSSNLLKFSRRMDNSKGHDNKNGQHEAVPSNEYLPESVWLQQALYDAELSSLYQHLISIDEQRNQVSQLIEKTAWLAEIIALNQQRKKRIVSTKEARNFDQIIQELTIERDRLSAALSQPTEQEAYAIFANKKESKWLERIKNSQVALSAIGTQKNTLDYQQRLARVQGVLSFEFTQQYPERSWQHKRLLQQVDNAIIGVNETQHRVSKASKTDDVLSPNIKTHQDSVNKLNLLLVNFAELRAKISAKIREKVNLYIDEQTVVLAEHLLSTRQGMANVLEKMASEDKKLSQQLTSSNVSNQYVLPEKNSVIAGAH